MDEEEIRLFLWPYWKVVFKMFLFKKSCVQYYPFRLLCTVLQKKLFSNTETVSVNSDDHICSSVSSC